MSFIAARYVGAVGCLAIVACASADCIVPDNGFGTATMPPVDPDCLYKTLDDDLMIIDGLPPGTTIEIDGMLGNFFNVVESPGGNLGGTRSTFNAFMNFPLVGTGGLNGYSRNLLMPLGGEMHFAPRTAFAPVQSFAADLFLLQGQLPPGDPDFDLLRITAGTGFGLPSPGQTTLYQTGPDWTVDSFFDITYRIDFVGAPGGPLAGMSGSTTGTIRFSINKIPAPSSALALACGLGACTRRRRSL